MNSSTPECKIVIPGKDVTVAFINRTLNTEDACLITKVFAESGTFAWMGYIDYRLLNSVEPGVILEKEYWWKPATKGVVTRVFMNKNGGLNVTVDIMLSSPQIQQPQRLISLDQAGLLANMHFWGKLDVPRTARREGAQVAREMVDALAEHSWEE
ncbi:hypothetical protein C1H76_1676 [Elsinoe australis]|uniref:Uncharacterized protein n=1 Tax=Elsinoe australis TaxID=40998 RepID=A0A4U7B953_9PEZI|nr:hypothetical protein C1H76_1676 [Elsinoe australis]